MAAQTLLRLQFPYAVVPPLTPIALRRTVYPPRVTYISLPPPPPPRSIISTALRLSLTSPIRPVSGLTNFSSSSLRTSLPSSSCIVHAVRNANVELEAEDEDEHEPGPIFTPKTMASLYETFVMCGVSMLLRRVMKDKTPPWLPITMNVTMGLLCLIIMCILIQHYSNPRSSKKHGKSVSNEARGSSQQIS